MMKNINIIPIFSQTAPVWDRFVAVRQHALAGAYGMKMSGSERDFVPGEFKKNWSPRTFNFAFGAYDDDRLVGFLSGDCIQNVATVRSLYVLPEYQHNGIGGGLLTNAERIVGFAARDMDLVSLMGATKFYESHGYRPLYINNYVSNQYAKMAPALPKCATVPVFHTTTKISRECNAIAKYNGTEFNPRLINSAHSPAFAYLNSASVIQGYSINDDVFIAPHQPVDFVRNRLTNAFGKYAAVMAMQHTK